jgi:hypothetical protein
MGIIVVVALTIVALVLLILARQPLPGLRDLAVALRAFFGWPT